MPMLQLKPLSTDEAHKSNAAAAANGFDNATLMAQPTHNLQRNAYTL